MKTFTELWKNYRDKVYPAGMPAQQNIEVHQAFFAGALQAMAELQTAADLPGDQALNRVTELTNEVNDVCRERIQNLKARN